MARLSQRTTYEQFVEGEGIAFEQLDILNIKEWALVTVGLGTFGVFNGATHPNAPSVYLNWLLPKEGHWPSARLRLYESAA